MKIKIVVLSFIILLLFLSGCVEQKTTYVCSNGEIVENASTCSQETTYSEQELNIAIAKNNQKNTEFFKEYAIALNGIHRGIAHVTLGGMNYIRAENYTLGDYYYIDAEKVLDTANQNSIDGEDYLNHAKKTLENIQNDAPNAFFRVEVENQLQHVNTLLDLSNKLYTVSSNLKNYLYAINYESEERAEELFQQYKDSVPEYNDSLEELSKIENKIDTKWDRNWYPTTR